MIEQLTEGDGSVEIRRLEAGFSLDDLLTRIGKDDQFVASFLYYISSDAELQTLWRSK